MQKNKLHKEGWMTEFSARIIGVNRVVSQDRCDRTSMTLEQSESIPAKKNKTATRVYLLFLQYHWWTRKGAIREITHNGMGTINPCLKCYSVFCFALQNHEKFLVSWRKTDASYQQFFFKRGETLKAWERAESVNGKQEERTVACVAMDYWYFEAKGRTEQEARSRGVSRVGTFIFLFCPSDPSFFWSRAQYFAAPHVQ